MQHADRLTFRSFELVTEQSLVLPNCLQQPFRRRIHVLAQEGDNPGPNAPLGVEVGTVVERRRSRELSLPGFQRFLPPHPDPLPQGEGNCRVSLSTIQIARSAQTIGGGSSSP